MLEATFETVVKMSMTASFTILLIIPIKILLQKISLPRKTLMLLWLVIAVRLLCPYAPQSNMSLFNVFNEPKSQTEIKLPQSSIHTYTSAYDTTQTAKIYADAYKNENKGKSVSEMASLIWVFGILTTLGYGILQNLILKKKLKFSTKLHDNIYQSDKINSSFVTGFFKPKIYIPFGCEDADKENMIIHEKIHISYGHNKLKTLAWLMLTLHWFNPLVWVAFRLISDDMEYVCDEIAISKASKKSYINSIVKIGSGCTADAIPPGICSFSSLSKRRIKNLIKYRKRNVFYSLPVVLICLGLVLFLNTNAVKNETVISSKPALTADKTKNVSKTSGDKEHNQTPTDTPDSYEHITNYSHLQKAETKEKLPETKDLIFDTGAATTHEPAPKSNLSEFKSNEKSDMPYGGFQHLEPDSISSEQLADELEKNMLYQAESDYDLSKNYIKSEYTSSKSGEIIPDVSCDNNGNISLYISLNTDSLFDVTVYDSDTGENVFQCMVLANGKNAFSMLGFDKNKKYDIHLQEATKGQWKTEGSYIIY